MHGWVRLAEERGSAHSSLALHAEGAAAAVDGLVGWLSDQPGVASVRADPGRPEGHEQFAVRGVAAGVFVVQEHQATAHHFDLRLQVGDVMRPWAAPKGPSLDRASSASPCRWRTIPWSTNAFEGRSGRGGVIVWDRGTYEQGGRVPWPEALERGHAVFVLHGPSSPAALPVGARSPGGCSSSAAPLTPDPAPTSPPSGPSRWSAARR